MSRRDLIWLAVLQLGLFACASSRPLYLNLNDEGPIEAIPGGRSRQIAVTAPFADERKVQDRCGIHENAFGREAGDVHCNGDPAAWVAELLTRQLRESGFEVLKADAPLDKSVVRIEGVLLHLFVEPVVSHINWIETDLHVRIITTSGSALRAERSFFVKRRIPGNIRMAKFYQESLDRGARWLVSEMVQAIIALMDRYPELGGVPDTAGRSERWAIQGDAALSSSKTSGQTTRSRQSWNAAFTH